MDNSNKKNFTIKKALFNPDDKNFFDNSQSLDLEIINSWNLEKGMKIHIEQGYLKDSLRNEKDNKIYFGYQKDLDKNGVKPFIDYILPPRAGSEFDEKFIGIHFRIKFDDNKYYIKDLGAGFGTFIKLDNEMKINNNSLINIGETFLVFTYIEDKIKNLLIKVFTGNEIVQNYEYNEDKEIILIGRGKDNDIIIDDKMISRNQCYLKYDTEKNIWLIYDGDTNGNTSTNETWLYAMDDQLIYDEMMFKSNHNLFKCHYY